MNMKQTKLAHKNKYLCGNNIIHVSDSTCIKTCYFNKGDYTFKFTKYTTLAISCHYKLFYQSSATH